MKKTLLRKALNRSIKQSFGRFLSIFMIIALGASLFSGLRNTPASMEASVSKDVKAAHFADLTYIDMNREEAGRIFCLVRLT